MGSKGELSSLAVLALVGLEGLEPSTNGFTCPRYFYREWTISSPSADLAFRTTVRVRDALTCY